MSVEAARAADSLPAFRAECDKCLPLVLSSIEACDTVNCVQLLCCEAVDDCTEGICPKCRCALFGLFRFFRVLDLTYICVLAYTDDICVVTSVMS